MKKDSKIWFRRKAYGWGWVPTTWQGWLVTFIYVASLIALSVTINEYSPASEIIFTFFLPIFLLTITLIRICYKKGEKPCWQWGVKKDNE